MLYILASIESSTVYFTLRIHFEACYVDGQDDVDQEVWSHDFSVAV